MVWSSNSVNNEFKIPKDCPLDHTELHFLWLVSNGESYEEIAPKIGKTYHATKTFANRVMYKLNCKHRAHAIAYCMRMGWLS